MKRFYLTFFLVAVSVFCYAQNMDFHRFYMPQIQSEADCAKYIGKKVRVFGSNSYQSTFTYYRNDFEFSYYYDSEHYKRIYTISNIKFEEQIEMRLVSDTGKKLKVKINNGGHSKSKELDSSNIFFLWDDFEAYKAELMNTPFKNSNNEDVAILTSLDVISEDHRNPVFVSTFKSLIDNSTFICKPTEAKDICKNLGLSIGNYRIVGVESNIDSEGEFIREYYDSYKYNYTNMTSGETNTCSKKDLSQVLSSIESNNIHLGKIYKNEAGEDVAIIEDIKTTNNFYSCSIELKSIINDEKFSLSPGEVADVCKYIGTVISYPNVKGNFKVMKVIGNTYLYEYTPTGETFTCSFNTISSAPLNEAMSGKYSTTLSKVEKPANSRIRYGKTTSESSDNGFSKYRYKDNIIDILIFSDGSRFYFEMENISTSSIKIIWDEAAFVNFDGSSERVMHSGIRYSDRGNSQPPTIIIKNSKLEDVAVPTNLIYYDDGWETRSMYPRKPGLKPGKVKLMLPIQIRDVINEYVFIFDVDYIYTHPEWQISEK